MINLLALPVGFLLPVLYLCKAGIYRRLGWSDYEL